MICLQVGTAAPVCVAMIAEGGGDRENTLSEMYGGRGDAESGANPLYEAIGDVSISSPFPFMAETHALSKAVLVPHSPQHLDSRMGSRPEH